MGMRGTYIAIDDDIVQKIIDNPSENLHLFDAVPDEYPRLEIDKAWEAIHFLLCGVSSDGEPPLGYVVPLRGENALDIEEIVCDIEAFALTHQQVQEAYHCIKDVGERELRSMFNFQSFVDNDIYASQGDDEDVFFEYISGYFRLIPDFFKDASKHNRGIVFYIM